MRTPASLFELHGVPRLGESIPLALQHLVAMIVGCITPSIIVAAAAGLNADQTALLIQSGLFVSGIATILQLFPLLKRFGAGLPIVFGVSFAYVPVLTSIAGDFGMAYLFGAQIVGALIAIAFGFFIGKLRKIFPAVVTGTVVVTIGLSLYPTAVEYMAGGRGSAAFGSPESWLVAFVTLGVVLFFSFFTKGFLKLASILFGIIAGYILALCLGMVDFSQLHTQSVFSVPNPVPFGIRFSPAAILPMAIMFIVNSVQVMGEVSATTSGAMNRLPTDKELSGGIMGNGLTSLFGAFFGAIPTSTFGQNVGIVTTTKIINKFVFLLTALFMVLAGFMPVIGAALTTIPDCVLGGATLSVFASITMTGVKLVVHEPLSKRNMAVAGIAIALGTGIANTSGSLQFAPSWAQTLFGSSAVVVATIAAVVLNLVLPKKKQAAAQQ